MKLNEVVLLSLVLLIVLVGIFLALDYTVNSITLPGGVAIEFEPPPTDVGYGEGSESAGASGEELLPVTVTDVSVTDEIGGGSSPGEEPVPVIVTDTSAPTEQPLPVTTESVQISSPRLLYESIRYDTNNDGDINFEDNRILAMMDIYGSEPTSLTGSAYSTRDASWSPDGGAIVFASDRDGDFDIYIMNPAENPLDTPWQQIVHNDGYLDRGPSWSPDGQWIAFYSDRDGDTEIYRMRIDGSLVQQLTHNQIEDEYPVWFPDGSLIYYQSGQECPIGDCQIHVMSADGQHQEVLLDQQSYWPSWSPNRRYFGASLVREEAQANICIWDMEAGTEMTLPGDSSTAQSWSPDSQQFAYATWVHGGPQIWLMNNDFSGRRQLTSAGWNTRPVFSP